MGEHRHTPGKWTSMPSWDGKRINIISDATSDGPGVSVDSDDVDPCVAEANARLIAAAPELLEALLRLVQSAADNYCAHCYCHPLDGHARGCPISEATRAIAKARGTR